jgi:FSR family fosmidomycin resistance protein-like MFS transporter
MNNQQAKETTFSTLLVLACIFVGHFLVDFMLGIWPVFKTLSGLDLALAGFMAGGCVVVGEGIQCYFGALSDKGYQRWLLLFGITLATGTCFLGYVSGFFWFGLLFMATCLGSAAFHPTAASILSNLNIVKRSTVMGLFTGAGMIGLGISQMLYSWSHHTYDGSTAYLAVPSLVLAIICFFFFKGRTTATQTEKTHSLTLFRRFLAIKELRALYLSMLGNQIVLWSLVFLLPDFLLERNYEPWVVFGGGHLFLMAGATLGPPVFGYLADRYASRGVIIWTSLLTLCCFYFLIGPVMLSQEYLFALLFVLGSMLGSVPPLIWALGGQLVPQHRGVISAFLMGFVWIFSESLGLGMSGFIASLFTEYPASCALAVMGGVQCISCFANAQLPKEVRELVIA